MDASMVHAKNRAQNLSHCDVIYVIHLSLKELGLPHGTAYQLALYTVKLLLEDPNQTLTNGIYLKAQEMASLTIEETSVDTALRRAIRKAWRNRDTEIWRCYFTKGTEGRTKCPSNREFLLAVMDFIILWKAFCEEVAYGK